MTTVDSNQDDDLVVPMYPWWKMLLISVFDVDFNKIKWTPSPDPEVRALNIFIPKFSWLQLIKMSVFQLEVT